MKWQDILNMAIKILNFILSTFGSAKFELSKLWLQTKGEDLKVAPIEMPSVPEPEKQEELPAWFLVAKKELGVKEKLGPEDNPRVVAYHAAAGLKNTKDSVPWCASFVCWCLEEVGIRSTRSMRARSFMSFGVPVIEPKLGDICVFVRDGGGHVGFYYGQDRDNIHLLGGNQSDKVSISKYPKTRLLGFRRPA